MKDKNTIIIIDIMLIVIAVALVIFLVVLNNSNDNDNEKVIQDGIEFSKEDVQITLDETLMDVYISNALGFKLKYYKEFARVTEVTEEQSMYKSAAMYRKEGNEGISVLIGSISDETTLETYINANVSAIMESNDLTSEDIVVIKEGVKLGNLDAYKVRYKMDDINIYQTATINDGKEYVVTYSAEDLYYDKQKAENMFSTFEFLN